MIKLLSHLFQIMVVLSGTVSLLKAQTVYSTSFNAGHGWTLNTYTNLNTTTEGDSPNIWYVSDNESNKGVGNIGGANCGNVTLHMGSTTAGDLGAAYDAGGCTNLGFGPCASCVANGLYCVQTDRSSISPAINTTGITGLTLSFLYIHWGTALLDNAQIIYSVNGGTTWILLANLPKSGCCTGAATCGTGCTANATCTGTHQGKWTLYSSALPASCQNISNLKVGFRWYNDDVSTSGRDPSVAVDDVSITTSVLPVRASQLQSVAGDNEVILSWNTYTEDNNKGFEIERAGDGMGFEKIGYVQPKNPLSSQNTYVYRDTTARPDQFYYYRYRQIDNDGRFNYSNIVSGEVTSDQYVTVYPNPAASQVRFLFEHEQPQFTIELVDVLGKAVYNYTSDGTGSRSDHVVDLKNIPPGVYYYKVSGQGKPVMGKLLIVR